MRWVAYFLAGLFTLVSAYFIYAACMMDTSVGDAGDSSSLGIGRIANLQLMQIQTLFLQMGLASAIIAAIFLATAFIISALPRQG